MAPLTEVTELSLPRLDGSAPWPDYLLARARRPAPAKCAVVAGTTPVVSFGNPLASIATLGINPSSGEFTDGSGELLDEERSRLATLESLGAATGSALSREQAVRIVDQCAAYFSRNPYHWFKKLDPVLVNGLGRSYWTGDVCHLDLVQWATDPLWSGITDVQRNELLRQDQPFLLEQLGQEHLQLVLVNGRTALNGVADADVVAWEQICRVARDPNTRQPAFDFYRGERAGCVFLGWSVNVPNQHGGLAARSTLAALVAEHGRPALAAVDRTAGLRVDPLASQGLHCTGRHALIDLLRRWLVNTDRQTLGDTDRFGSRAWLTVATSAGTMQINADTTRPAISHVVQRYEETPAAPWIVVANRRGRTNKVLVDTDPSMAGGWYAYLTRPVDVGTEVR